jgi:GH43 family beta-xylosidase
MFANVFLLALTLTVSAVDATAESSGTFVNPVVPSGADPWVIRRGNAYYFCQSHDGAIWVGVTDRLERLGSCDWRLVWTPPLSSRYSQELWAPELHFLRGRWYIYVAADEGRNRGHRMIVLEGSRDDPQAPFVLKGVLSAATDRWAIDGTVLEMPGGNLYFIWSGWPGKENGVQNIYIARMSSPTTIQGDRVCISHPQYAWEKHGRPHVNEGPEVLRHGSRLFIIYSASRSRGDDYCLGQLTLTGRNPMNPNAWVKKPLPVFSRTNTVFGPGHASFTTSPDGRENWIVYHAAKAKGSGWDRDVRIQPFGWNRDGSPDFGQPVSPGVAIPVPGSKRSEAEGKRSSS